MIVVDNLPVAVLVFSILFAVLWLVVEHAVSVAISSSRRPRFRARMESSPTGPVLVLDNVGEAPAIEVALRWAPSALVAPFGEAKLLAQGATWRVAVPAAHVPRAVGADADDQLAKLLVRSKRDLGARVEWATVPVLLPGGDRTG